VRIVFLMLLFVNSLFGWSKTIEVGKNKPIKTIKEGLNLAQNGDTILVHSQTYQEGNIEITKSIYLKGINYPVIDGDKKFEVLSVKANNVTIDGFRVQHSGYATLDDPGGIKVYESQFVNIINNHLYDNFFGIYIQYSSHCLIKNNRIVAFGKEEQEIGNGIHCWKSDSLQIIGNNISGHRDGIYFEFVTSSVIWRNISHTNIRYGLHFMFSNNDAYITNYFKNNGAGVAVMFTKKIVMYNNTFEENWGDASYGILLKEISDCEMVGNKFKFNTSAVYMDGTSRMYIAKNWFYANGWGLKIQANCMDNVLMQNNFTDNTFDVSTNGTLVLNTFKNNYWDKYKGYDLNKDGVGDVSYHPLSLFALLVENNQPVMLLFQSFFVNLLEQTEKILPSLTPDTFIDNEPLMRPIKL